MSRLLRLYLRRLDDPATRAAVESYFRSEGTTDYERSWLKRLGQIIEVLLSGERDLSRVLGLVVRNLERERYPGMRTEPFVLGGRVIDLPVRPGGALHRAAVVEMLCDLCNSNTSSVVELGSGWGEHLASLWLQGGPRKARYFALELSEYGRKCALALAMLDRHWRLRAAHFDYLRPNFAAVPSAQQDVVVFSVHSVEQVHELPAVLIPEICALGRRVRVMHLEPVGWQMVPQERWSETQSRHHKRCQELRYNANLWQLLKQAEGDGIIEITAAVPDFFGREYNAASLIVWEKRLEAGT